MGAVYLARDLDRDLDVALKVLPFVEGPSLLRFKTEFRSLVALSHPNLVGLYELISDDDRWFFTMDVVHGTDFLSWVRPHGHLDEKRLRNALRGLVSGVDALHAAGLLHRDIKPSNVMVREDGHVVLLDFGLAVEVGVDLTSESTAGTLTYMAPEQSIGEPLGRASDWYAVGVMLFEALTGDAPFHGNLLQIIRAKMSDTAPLASSRVASTPPDLDALCAALLSSAPERRPSGADILTRCGIADVIGQAPAGVAERVPFVGRDSHLTSLQGTFDVTQRGGCVAALVHGRSGAGKTMLVGRFLEGLVSRDDAVVLRGRCHEQETVPYKGVDSLVDALTKYLRHLPSGQAEVLLPRHIEALVHVFPVLQRVEAIASAPQADVRNFDPQELRRRAFAALRELLARIGDRAPLVLAIDDLQWGDVDSAIALAQLLQPPDPPRLLLIVSYRSEYEQSSRCLQAFLAAIDDLSPDRVVRLPVGALDLREAEELAGVLLAGAGLPPEHAARIARESGGNAFYVSELIQHVTADTPVADGGSSVDESAPRLDNVLWQRVMRLPERARQLLEAVAIAGRPVRMRIAYAVAGLVQLDYAPMFRLRNERYVRSSGVGPDDDLETYHDRIRETITARLDVGVLRRLHLEFGDALEQSGDEDPESLALHFDAAGQPERAGVHSARAAASADRALAFDRAAQLYRRALERLPATDQSRHALEVRFAHALANAGLCFEAATAYETAAASATADDKPELRRLAAMQYCIAGQMDRGQAIFQTLLRDLGLSLPSTKASSLALLAWRRLLLRLRGLSFSERSAGQIPALELRRIDALWSVSAALSVSNALAVAALQTHGLILALKAGDPYRIARSLSWEAFLTSTGGWRTVDQSARLSALADTMAAKQGDPHLLALAQLSRSIIAHTQARQRDAARDALIAEEMLTNTCTGVWWELQTARTIATWATWQMGEYADLQRLTSRYYSEARERGDLYTVTNLGSVALPHLALAADDAELARAHAREALRLWTPRGFQIQHGAALFSEMHADLYTDVPNEALRRITEAWPVLRRELQLQTQLVLMMFLDVRARSSIAAVRAAEPSLKRKLLASAERDARRIERERTRWGDAFANTLHAGIAHRRGDVDQARRRLAAGAPILDDLGFTLRAAISRYYVASLDGSSAQEAKVAAETFMRERLIVRPDRFARVLVPGFSM